MERQLVRIRVCLAVVRAGKILLVPHYHTDQGEVQWNLPGGRVGFGESIRQAAAREFHEETGLVASVDHLLDVSEVILPERSWHTVTITFLGRVVGGQLRAEPEHPFGEKMPRWFSPEELRRVRYHPKESIDKPWWEVTVRGGSLRVDYRRCRPVVGDVCITPICQHGFAHLLLPLPDSIPPSGEDFRVYRRQLPRALAFIERHV